EHFRFHRPFFPVYRIRRCDSRSVAPSSYHLPIRPPVSQPMRQPIHTARYDRKVATGLFLAFAACVVFSIPACKHEPLIDPMNPSGQGTGGGGGTDPEPVDTCNPSIVYFEQQIL